ncbi:hypothetical protein V6N13_027958 [Hibiscus sabdariffa]|uniref:F-box associated beta-propeller type 1 domain-containing protein n=1 Tax=Hibiscus sabdariffa TaxID=183260 RepID=A0ABR2CG40_9ROSI
MSIFVKLHLQKRSKYIMLRTFMLGQQGSHFLLLPLSKVQGEDPPMKEVEFPLIADFKFLRGSCDGMVCLTSFDGEALIFNPFIHSHVPLPSLNFEERFDLELKETFIRCGLGYSLEGKVREDVKIVKLYVYKFLGEDEDEYMNQVFVFSMKSYSWTQINDCPYRVTSNIRLIQAGGALHWILQVGEDFSDTIKALDLTTLAFYEVEKPSFGDGLMDQQVLGELNESLSICCARYPSSTMKIWVLKSNADWEMVFSVQSASVDREIVYRPVYRFENGQMLFHSKDELVLHDVDGTTLKTIQFPGSSSIYEFVVIDDSLLLPGSIRE